ncbi:HIT domain-containing protein [Beutenbergia cavernae]|uniref:HIT domain-containing protein n=1 Tax=Beutenbergia cavernae TaxID=84757 RepID=UPI0005BE8213|nr:HIT domain-containing protein [Beutenbergia cavernae]
MTGVAACVLCRIVAGTEPATVRHATDAVVVIEPLVAHARVHLLVVPREHFDSVAAMARSAPELAGEMIVAADDAARAVGMAHDGYRLTYNWGPATRQRIVHPHLHVLGGQVLGERLG